MEPNLQPYSRMNHHFSSASVVGILLTLGTAAAAPPSPSPNLPPAQALQELVSGNQRFIAGSANACADASFARSQTANGQAPSTIVLSCSDSRVPPEQVFDQELGQLFVVRVAGNILNPDAIASMEYAITTLGSRLILVLGHESCGAVKSALGTPAGKDAGSPSLNQLLAQIRTNLGSTTSSSDPKLRAPAIKNIDSVADDLLLQSTIIHDTVNSGQVQIERGIYDLDSGKVDLWSATGKEK